MKRCCDCDQEKPLEEFRKNSRNRDGKHFYCKPCHSLRSRRTRDAARDRRSALIRLYGITPEDYDALLTAQGGACAVCGGPPSRSSFDVDHCHTTGRVRGLLCSHCNKGLGLFADDPARLRAAAEYLTPLTTRV